jgi:hypothetical protein
LDLSRICTDLVHGDTVRSHGQMFITSLNDTRLLDAVVSRHSFQKSVCYSGGAAGGVGLFICGCFVFSGLPLVIATVAGGLGLAVGTVKTLEHNEYRDRVKQGMEMPIHSG